MSDTSDDMENWSECASEYAASIITKRTNTMSKDNEKSVKGKVVKVKKDKEFETKGGKDYTAHVLVIEDEEGDEQSFRINTKIKAAEFVAKLKEGDKVTVKTGGEYNSVQAVFKEGFGDKKGGGGFAKTNRREYDPTGAIQGMVLKAAIDLAIANQIDTSTPVNVEQVVDAAKEVLLAKLKIDKLVSQALKPKEDEDDGDEDSDREESKKDSRRSEEDSDDSEEDEEAPKARKKKSSPY